MGTGAGIPVKVLLTAATAWEWARAQKDKVVAALVRKAISGHHPSIELYLAYVDGRPVETFKTFNLTANVSAEDIRSLAETVAKQTLAFNRELGIGAVQMIDGAAQTLIEASVTPCPPGGNALVTPGDGVMVSSPTLDGVDIISE
jgi:hypothetical protein